MPYSAGEAFLQITPSFQGVAKAISAEADKWGESGADSFASTFNAVVAEATKDALGSVGAGASEQGSSSGGAFAEAFKAHVEAALADLPDVEINADSTYTDEKIAEIRAELESLSGQTIGIDLSDTEAVEKLATFKAELDILGSSSESVRIKVDTAAASAELGAFALELEAVKTEADVPEGGGSGGGFFAGLIAQADEASFSLTGLLVPAIGALVIAAIPLAGVALGGLTALPAILAGVGSGVAAIALAAPAIEALAKTTFDPLVNSLRPLVDAAILPGIQSALTAIVPLFNDLSPFIVSAASGIGQLAAQFGAFLGSTTGMQELNTIFQAGAGFMSAMGQNALTLFQAFVSAGAQAAPVIIPMLVGGITSLVNSFSHWVSDGGFQAFLTWLQKNGPSVVKSVGDLLKSVGQFIVALAPVGLVFDGLLGDLGKLLSYFAKTPAAFAAVALAAGGLGIALAVALDTNPVGLIITAIGLLVIGITELVTHWDQIWGEIKTTFDTVVSFLRSGFGTLVLLLTGPLAPLLLLALHWQQVWATIQAVASTVWSFIDTNLVQPLTTFFTVTLPGILSDAVGFFTALPGNIVKGLGDIVGTIFAGLTTVLTWLNTNVWQPVSGFFTAIPGEVAKFFVGFFDTAWAVLTTVLTWLNTNVWQPVSGFFTAIPGEVAKFFVGFFDTAWAVLTTVLTWLNTNVWQPVSGFFTAIPGEVAKFFVGFFDTAWAVLTTVLTWLNTNVWQPVSGFFTAIPGEVAKFFVGFFDTAWADLTSIATWLDKNVWDPMKTFFTGLPKRVASAVGNLLGDITGSLTGDLGGVVSGVVHLFASGGIVTTPTAGVVGEAGPEAILPLNDPQRTAQILAAIGVPMPTAIAPVNVAALATLPAGLGNAVNFPPITLNMSGLGLSAPEVERVATNILTAAAAQFMDEYRAR